ncbi:hypothetical protein [Mycetohabitans sp. B46]
MNASHPGISIHHVNVAIGDAGGGVAHENRPPYYALCFVEYRSI